MVGFCRLVPEETAMMNGTELRYRMIFTEERLGDIAGDIVVLQTEIGSNDDARADALEKAARHIELARRELRQAIRNGSLYGDLSSVLALSIADVQGKKNCAAIGAEVITFRGPNNNAG
jgi:hypothetical protein